MRKIQSRDLPVLMDAKALSKDDLHHCYNALDSAVTLKVHESLSQLLAASPPAQSSYAFVRQMQGPALAMMNMGVAIQQKVRADETARYQNLKDQAQARLDLLADTVWGPEEYIETTKTKEVYAPTGKNGRPLQARTRVVRTDRTLLRPRGLNAGSAKQTIAFFTIALGLPIQHEIRKTSSGHERTPSANDKALEKWRGMVVRGPGIHPRDRAVVPVHLAAPFVSLILTIRNADKMLGVLKTPLDPDGRMRCSYNVAGTETGRWSSSKNVYGRGNNLQNITEEMRRMFCADDGYIMVSTDLEQAESRVVAGMVWEATGDTAYWDACEGPDLHTQVVRMTYPELEWTDDIKLDRAIAEQPSREIPSYSYRDIAKRLGHGSNYRGSAFGIAQAVGLPVRLVEDFQRRYFAAFPSLPAWHADVNVRLRRDQYLDTPLGRRRHFFSRPWEDSTLREAIAFGPQSVVAELLNAVMLAVWRRSLKTPPIREDYLPIQLLLQNHDAFCFEVPTKLNLANIISEVNNEFNAIPIKLTHKDQTRLLTIPGEFVVGWNWGKVDPTHRYHLDGNPDGLQKWLGSDTRTRAQTARTSPADWLRSTGGPRW